jgi:hypothetical protein
MTEDQRSNLGKTLWGIADQLRGAMNADDFRDYMLSFLFLRYLSDNFEAAAARELGPDYPQLADDDKRTPLAVWYANNADDVPDFEAQMRRKTHYIIHPAYLWRSIAEMARTQDDELLQTLERGFGYIENESFSSAFDGLFSEINLNSEKLGRTPVKRNAKLCEVISTIATEIAQFGNDSDVLGDAYEYLIGQFASGAGKKGRVLYAADRLHDSFAHRQPGRPGPGHGQQAQSRPGAGLRLWLRFAAVERAQANGPRRHRQDLRPGTEHHHLQPGAHEYAAARGEGYRVRHSPRRFAGQRLGSAGRDEPGQKAGM